MNVIFWFLVVVFVSWLVILFVIPFLGRIFLRKLTKNFRDHIEHTQKEEIEPEGSVHIDNIPTAPEKKKDLGDYVNYEEINEK